MRIPARTLIALSLILLGAAQVAWAVGVLWEPAAAVLVVGLFLTVVGILLGVSE